MRKKDLPLSLLTGAICATSITLLSLSDAYAAGAGTGNGGSANLARIDNRMAQKDWDGAVNALNHVIAAHPDDTKAMMMRATCFYQLGNYKLSIQDLDQALKSMPGNVRALLLRGSSHAKLNQDDDAVSDYQAAIKLDKSLAIRYYMNGGPAEVKRDTTGSVHEGLNLHAVNDYQKAMDALYPNGLSAEDKAQAATPEMVEVTPSGGSKPVNVKSEDKRDGSPSVNLVDNTTPGAGEFQGNAQKAVANLTEVLRGNQNNAETYYKRGKAYQKLGKVDNALKDYASAIERDPQKSQYYIARASVFYQLGKTDLCQNEIGRARSVDPDVPAKVDFNLPKYPATVKWNGGDGPSNP
ncbi:MAG: tetratricopeptide repeat protein [Cyanobacteria bacterium REEB67]|nr:tetratricopeptide repeat protein [Cyanobacteria bacterium REEB67]